MRRLISAVSVLVAACAAIVVGAAPAHAYEVQISIYGAGQVTETTPANLVGGDCASPATTPTGVLGDTCSPGDPSGDYGWGWTVRLVATPKPGYRFVHWTTNGSGDPVICDGADGSATYTGTACQFGTYANLQTRAVFVDDTPPTMSSLTGPNQPVSGPAIFTFSAAADPTLYTFECRVAGVHDWQSCTHFQQHVEDLPTGTYTLEVRAVDRSNNRSAALTKTWTVDKLAPETSISSGPSGTVASNSAQFEFTSNEAGAFTCSVDESSAPCGSPKSYAGLAEGPHTFTVAARDAAGNTDPTPATRTWTVDTVAPRVISKKPTGRKVSRGANPRVLFSEAMRASSVTAQRFYLLKGTRKVAGKVTYRRTSRGGDYVAVLDPKKRLRANQTYTVVVRGAVDVAGNRVRPASWKFRTKR
jgi:hypothetical protein